MSVNDPIADMLTRVRNGVMAGQTQVAMPSSKIKAEIAKILKDEGFLESFEVVDDEKTSFRVLRLKIKYVGERRERREQQADGRRHEERSRQPGASRHHRILACGFRSQPPVQSSPEAGRRRPAIGLAPRGPSSLPPRPDPPAAPAGAPRLDEVADLRAASR